MSLRLNYYHNGTLSCMPLHLEYYLYTNNRYVYACRCYLTAVGNHSVLPSYPGSWCRCLDYMRLLSPAE